MNIQNAYNNWSQSYDNDENLTRDLDARITRKTLERLQAEVILEIGCGTGKNTGFLAQIGTTVHAVDFSQGMISKARQKVTADNVHFSTANLSEPWPSADKSAGLVVCNLVLEHIENISFVFSEASRTLCDGGFFFVSELHPFRQYLGRKANFQRAESRIEIPAYVHHISDFLDAARQNGLALKELHEWWHEDDEGKPPRLISFMFEK